MVEGLGAKSDFGGSQAEGILVIFFQYWAYIFVRGSLIPLKIQYKGREVARRHRQQNLSMRNSCSLLRARSENRWYRIYCHCTYTIIVRPFLYQTNPTPLALARSLL
jgi:hypothetical protein